MTEQEREQAAIAEYNQFVQALQHRYGVKVRQCIVTQDYDDGEKTQGVLINIKAIEGWQPPVPNIAVGNGAVIMPDAEPPNA